MPDAREEHEEGDADDDLGQDHRDEAHGLDVGPVPEGVAARADRGQGAEESGGRGRS